MAGNGEPDGNGYHLHPEGGPRSWLLPMVESAHSVMRPKAAEESTAQAALATAERATVLANITDGGGDGGGDGVVEPGPLRSRLRPGATDVLADPPRDFWRTRLREYYRRKAAAAELRAAALEPGALEPGMPAVPGVNNWVPIGPSVASRGQADGRPAIAGRTSRLAIAAGGARMYAATANGGVFRSDDGGDTWRSTMDGFDTDPTSFAAASLCCGAIAVSATDPDRVYVGTGEGDTNAIFTLRLTNALPAYRGIGPIRSDDGGGSWVSEPATPDLAGFDFFALAVDPADQDNVVAATSNGLYQRTTGAAGPSWQQRRTGAHTSVVVSQDAAGTHFVAAPHGGGVLHSTDGATWTALGTGFPTANVGRVALGVRPDHPEVLYALVADANGGLLGLFRLDALAGAWAQVANPPALLPGGQGDYDLCIAVDPTDANLVYLGGDRTTTSPFPGSIHRCAISAAAGGGFTMATTSIGSAAHADVHTLAFPPGDRTRLWTGTDGGVFVNRDPAGVGLFESRNLGLSSLCANYLGLSATEPAVVFCGLQDNGTIRYTGEELWRDVLFGDGGYCVVHPTDPFTVLAYANGQVFRTTTGGRDWGDWTLVIHPSWGIMAEPLVGAPGGSTRVAFGAFTSAGVAGVYVSDDFGVTWPAVASPTLSLPAGSGGVFSMVFASADRLFLGTTAGRVFRADHTAAGWSLTRIDNAAGGALGLVALVSDLAVDWSDGTLSSVYACLGGSGDPRHVWRFTGGAWQVASGTGGTALLDVEHNAIVVDPANPATVYVAADIGVWQSTDSGGSWTPLERGLPDAPVLDLQIHQGARLLRAATYGRGVYEYRLDPPALSGAELYIRDTALDVARGGSTDGHNDPTVWPTTPVWHWRSPNIKVDVPTPAGYQTPTDQLNFFQFHETLVDGSQGVATIGPPQVVHNRFYALVHNRGPLPEPSVRVLAAVANASAGLPALPAGYTANVQAGTALPGPDWTTLGVVTLTDLRPGVPQVAAFDLPSTVLPLPASLPGQQHFCSLVLLHSANDPFTSTEQNVDVLTVADRKVAQKNLHLVQFVGTPPPPSETTGMWLRLRLGAHLLERESRVDLVVAAHGFTGQLGLVGPRQLLNPDVVGGAKLKGLDPKLLTGWLDAFPKQATELCHQGQLPERDLADLLAALERLTGAPLLAIPTQHDTVLRGLVLKPGEPQTVFLRVDPPVGAKPGSSWEFSVFQRDPDTGQVLGGSTYSVQVVPPPQR